MFLNALPTTWATLYNENSLFSVLLTKLFALIDEFGVAFYTLGLTIAVFYHGAEFRGNNAIAEPDKPSLAAICDLIDITGKIPRFLPVSAVLFSFQLDEVLSII